VQPKVYYRLTDNWLELTVRFVVADHGIRDVKDAMSRDMLAELDAAAIPDVEPQSVSSQAEGGLTSEAGDIEEQAKHSRMSEAGANLLQADGEGPPPKPEK